MENINEENLDASIQDGTSNEADNYVPLNVEELEDMEVVDKDNYLSATQYAKNQKIRAEKAEAQLKELRDNSVKPAKTVEEQPQKETEGDEFSKFAKYSSIVKDLDSDEIEQLTLEAQELGVSPEKFVQSTAGKASLKEFRNKKREDNKTPSPSSRMAVYGGKSYHEIALDPKASKADKQKAFEAQMAAKKG